MIDSVWLILLWALGMIITSFLIDVHPIPQNLNPKYSRIGFTVCWPVLALFIGIIAIYINFFKK